MSKKKCEHSEGFYARRRVTLEQYYTKDGEPDGSEVIEGRRGGTIAYCSLCDRRIGKVSDFVGGFKGNE